MSTILTKSHNNQLKLLLSILLSCGDIQINPGPITRYSCEICRKSIKSNVQSIQCEKCSAWYHTNCCNVNTPNTLSDSCIWICNQCDVPNFSTSLLNNHLKTPSLLSNSFSALDNQSSPQATPSRDSNTVFASTPNPIPKSKRVKAKRHLKGMIINCNGLKGTSRFTEFQALLDLHNPDVVLGTESKLHNDIPTYSVFPSNYTVYRKDRNANGGGVFHAVKSDIVCEECPKFDANCEILWSSVKFQNSKKLYLASYYRPPNSSSEALDELQKSINCVFDSSNHHPNIILGGDFNLGDINWKSESPELLSEINSLHHKKLLQTLDDFSLTQHVTLPTRPASNKTLDLLLSSFPNNVSNVNIDVAATRSFKPPHKVFIYKKADFTKLNEFMSHASENFFLSSPQHNSVSENWLKFKLTLIKGIQDYVPHKKSTPKYKLPWITSAIKRHMRLKDRLHKKALKSHKPKHWDEFKKERNLVSRLVKQSHSSYLNDVIGASLDTNPKKFWSYVRTSKSESSGIPPLKFNDKLCVSDKSKADALNSQFHSVFTRENAPIPNKGQSPYTSISDLIINSQGVAKQLSELNPSKACGPDEIPARILKELSPSISHWLCFIFQQSYDSGTLPPDWSKALVSAVFKKDLKSNPANYRPISLTCLCCKVMEHIILSHVSKHLAYHDILINEQHGFRKLFSCETQLITAINDWAKSINQKKQTDVILLDFSIRGLSANWIKAFLSNRSQVVSVNGSHSHPHPRRGSRPWQKWLEPRSDFSHLGFSGIHLCWILD